MSTFSTFAAFFSAYLTMALSSAPPNANLASQKWTSSATPLVQLVSDPTLPVLRRFARFQFPKTRKHCTSLLASSITITASSPDVLRAYNLFTWRWRMTVSHGLPPVSKHSKQPKRLCQRLWCWSILSRMLLPALWQMHLTASLEQCLNSSFMDNGNPSPSFRRSWALRNWNTVLLIVNCWLLTFLSDISSILLKAVFSISTPTTSPLLLHFTPVLNGIHHGRPGIWLLFLNSRQTSAISRVKLIVSLMHCHAMSLPGNNSQSTLMPLLPPKSKMRSSLNFPPPLLHWSSHKYLFHIPGGLLFVISPKVVLIL